MKIKPCKCCEDGQPGHSGTRMGFGYNRLENEAREWAKENKFARSEYCVRVKGGKRFGGPDWIKKKCGNGRMGFITRRRSRDEVKMEQGLDGQLKRRRPTLLNRRSARAAMGRQVRRVDGSRVGLVSSEEIMETMRDPIVVAQQRAMYKKSKRAHNRNNKARRGHRRAMQLTS